MKIQIHRRYEGNRAKFPIELGIYDAGDKRLYGLWRYLIDNGNAREYIEPVVKEIAYEHLEIITPNETVEEVVVDIEPPKKRATRSDKGKPRKTGEKL